MKNICRLASVVAASLAGLSASLAHGSSLPATYKFTPNTQLDAVFATFDSTTSPGCSAAAAQDGKLIYSRGYGMANLDHSVPITPQTPFHVASVSKQFTAAAIVLLAQDGKLSLDDDVRKHLPEVPDLGATITLRQMIHHTSGLRDQWDLLGMAGWRYSKDRISDDDVLRLMTRQRKLNFAPGSQFLYSNMGYTLLALVVKRVSGQSLREFTGERIFKPLGMNSTHFRDDHAEIVPGFANGYERAGDSFRTSVTNFDTTGATSLVTTAEDLDGALQRVGRDGSSQALLALGGNRFRFEPFPIVLEFNGTGDQRVIKARFGDQKPATLQLVPAFTPSAAELNEYIGLFGSEELDARYRMHVTDGKLQVATLKRDALALHPVTKDVFATDFGTVTFVRDGDGRIDGFSLSTGRAWNNEFAKLEQ